MIIRVLVVLHAYLMGQHTTQNNCIVTLRKKMKKIIMPTYWNNIGFSSNNGKTNWDNKKQWKEIAHKEFIGRT